jgi:hypothetical protein
MQRSLAHAIARVALAIVFVYQGLVPKLWTRHPSELAMLEDGGLRGESAVRALLAIGAAEVALGVLLVAAWRARWPLAVVLALMPLALVAVAVGSPSVLRGAFNPVALNVAVAALAAIGLATDRDLPSASRCLRVRPAEQGSEPT